MKVGLFLLKEGYFFEFWGKIGFWWLIFILYLLFRMLKNLILIDIEKKN